LGGLELISGLGSELVEGGNGESTGVAGQDQDIPGVAMAGRAWASTASVSVQVCIASAKRLVAWG